RCLKLLPFACSNRNKTFLPTLPICNLPVIFSLFSFLRIEYKRKAGRSLKLKREVKPWDRKRI
ncbi:MAG: hypothetical protein WBN53_00225, partial [Thermodesulfobacteriota bacterium]